MSRWTFSVGKPSSGVSLCRSPCDLLITKNMVHLHNVQSISITINQKEEMNPCCQFVLL
jgi:hypothetical protein